jgi:hypothetical protein
MGFFLTITIGFVYSTFSCSRDAYGVLNKSGGGVGAGDYSLVPTPRSVLFSYKSVKFSTCFRFRATQRMLNKHKRKATSGLPQKFLNAKKRSPNSVLSAFVHCYTSLLHVLVLEIFSEMPQYSLN